MPMIQQSDHQVEGAETQEGSHHGDQDKLRQGPPRVADRHREPLAATPVAEPDANRHRDQDRNGER